LVYQPITVQQIQIPIEHCLDSQMRLDTVCGFYSDDTSFLPVLNNDKIIGVLPLKRILEITDEDKKSMRVIDVASKDFRVVSPDVSFSGIITDNPIKHIIVTTNGQVSGVIYIDDTLIRLYEAFLDIQNNLQEIIDTVDDGIGVADAEGRIVLLNKSYERLTGLSKEEAGLGKLLVQVVKEKIISQSISQDVMKYKTKRTIVQKIKTGREVLATGMPIFDKEGNVKRVIVNFRDLFYLNRLHSQFGITKSNDELRGKMSVKTPAMEKVIELVARVAPVDITVLILGESGVGKEVVAREIVNHSSRSKRPFVHINCGAIPENLLESELFGYEGGAFSGAVKEGKAGLFEIANNGTIFLDEVSEMPLPLQVKLLCFLQDHTIRRVGSTKPINLNVRIIAATNKNLESLVDQGLFRHDLYYRLNVVPIIIPALRQRRDDIAPLTQAFLEKFNKKYSLNKKIGLHAIQVLENYEWPGNVRQLENIIERLVIMTEGSNILPQSIKEYLCIDEPSTHTISINDIVIPNLMPLKKAVSIVEKELVKRALDTCGTTRAAATALGVAHTSIIRKVAKHKLSQDLPQYRSKSISYIPPLHLIGYPEEQDFDSSKEVEIG
jgi:PAS domain S-box-containing protein